MSELREQVRDKYAAAALRVTSGAESDGCGCGDGGCCGSGSTSASGPVMLEIDDTFGSALYSVQERGELPVEAVAASLGCGNPTAVADLHAGERVLDLGSGGGIDVLLSASRVGPAGKVYGLDMTDEMLALARENQRKAGATNVEFLKGTIEAIPLPDCTVDVIISNCVINLSSDKDAVFREAFRVLKPGARFSVSDVIVRGDVPADVRRSMELWIGCIAGALEEREYAAKLTAAGFVDVDIEAWRVYKLDDATAFLREAGLDVDRLAAAVEGRFASATIRARKPDIRGCCGPDCCS